ncbi:hypothetical protein Q9L58_006947 [Maublancomyces gigas]|uniref:Uncharacterized protein n=1 Tax=Discina gigas TaxID=1032678 RepID=A0ABR3GE07_9PEZI
MENAAHVLGFKPLKLITDEELQKLLAQFNTIEVPPTAVDPLVPTTTPDLHTASPDPASVTPDPAPATPPLRRSRRLLGQSPPPISPGRVTKKTSPRARGSPCRICKGKDKDKDPPIKIRMTMISKVQFTDEDAVTRVRMGFKFLPDIEDAGNATTMVLMLGTDMVAEELEGLDMVEVDVRLGFAEE